MINTAMANGFTSAETVACSQELDILITQYQKKLLTVQKTKKVYQTFNSIYTFFLKPSFKTSDDIKDL
ncbi:aspartyl-phosphate phosphatase Spo0E family protein [Bacillus sp. RD4P76]|uniref:Aspartyl-phosphate phosphatase Spo0E family protein n=2 Tax=Bacillus suaedaesalsae TaxID=2810349 RepID=A0ABS2DHX7_9BACI|nr:aspartyl-phosphate phosphatase Spo0E family protein [Bacillus suaedaesalsae]